MKRQGKITTFVLDEEIHRKFKMYCAAKKISMSKILTKLIIEEIKKPTV